jgi:hypothetical protein
MQEQVFTVTIAYEDEISLQVIKDWLKAALADKVTRYIGVVVDSYGGSASGRTIRVSLRLIHNEPLPAATLKSYLTDPPAAFTLEIEKR